MWPGDAGSTYPPPGRGQSLVMVGKRWPVNTMIINDNFLGTFVTKPMSLAPRIKGEGVWLETLLFGEVEVVGLCAWAHPCLLSQSEVPQLIAQGFVHAILEEITWARA